MDEEFYITTILERHYLAKNTFAFSILHCATGNYDKKTGVFTDDINGEEYCSIIDMCQLTSEVPYAFNKVINVDELQELYGETDDDYDVIKKYEDDIKNFVYIVRVVDGVPRCFVINFADGKNDDENYVEDTENTVLENNVTSNVKETMTQKEQLDLVEKEVVSGVYSASQLKLLKDSIKKDIDKYESITDLINEKLEEKEDPTDDTLLDINKIYKKITKTLIAQDAPTRRLLVELARKISDTDEELKKNRPGILITGSTGVGKTKLLSLAAENLHLPFMIVDSTQLTMPGYVGKSIENSLWDLYVKCDKDKDKAEHAIIYFDEIDKKGSDSKSDVAGQGVLNTLLKFLDGATYTACANPQQLLPGSFTDIDTSKMIILAGGAFADLYEKFNNRKEAVGFKTSDKKEKAEPTIEDFYDVGMPKEFMGRFPTIIHLNDLSKENLKDVFTKSDESPLLREKEHFKKVGVKLTATDNYIDAIANKAYQLKYGARGLAGLTLESTWMAYDEVATNKDKYSEVIVSKETFDDSSKYKLIEKNKRLVKK